MQFERVTVAIPTHNRAHILGETIAAVLKHLDRLGRGDLLIVDNNSTDGTPAMLRELCARDPRVRVLHETRQGVVFARQTIVANFDGDALVFIDDDVVPSDDWLEAMLGVLGSDPNLGVVGAAIDAIWDVPRADWMTDYHLREIPILPLPDGPKVYVSPDIPPGVSLAMRNHPCLRYYLTPERVANPLGWGAPQPPGFPPLGGEDHDLCELYVRAGFTVLATDKARVGHRVTPDKANWNFYIRKGASDGHLRVRWARLTGLSLFAADRIKLLVALPAMLVLRPFARFLPPIKNLSVRCMLAKSLGAWRELLFGPRGVRFTYPTPDQK